MSRRAPWPWEDGYDAWVARTEALKGGDAYVPVALPTRAPDRWAYDRETIDITTAQIIEMGGTPEFAREQAIACQIRLDQRS